MPSPRGQEGIAGLPVGGRREPRYATANQILALALIGAVFGVLLLATLIAIFPAAIGATTASGRVAPVPLLFGLFEADLGPDTALLVLVVLSSAAGSFVHIATSFANYAGRNRLETSWLAWYALRGIIGAALAIVFYFVLRAGFFSGDATNAAVNAYGIAAVAGFVGLFSRQATDKLRELFDTLFKTDSTEEEVDPVIHVVSPDPAVVTAGEPVRLTIEGSGFVRLSQVRIDGNAVNPTSIGPTQIKVGISPAILCAPGIAEVTVLNPGPNAQSDAYMLQLVTGE